jgi:hypothetical protein
VIVVHRIAHSSAFSMVTVAWNQTFTGHLWSLFDSLAADPHKVAKSETTKVWTADQDPKDGNHHFDGIDADRFATNYKKQAGIYLENKRLNGAGPERVNGNDGMGGIAESK